MDAMTGFCPSPRHPNGRLIFIVFAVMVLTIHLSQWTPNHLMVAVIVQVAIFPSNWFGLCAALAALAHQEKQRL